MAPICEFFFDLNSSYSYLASTQLAGLAQRTGARIVLVPMLLGAITKATGSNVGPMQRLQYTARDMLRWAERYRIPFTLPSSWPTRSVLGLRCVLAAGEGREAAMHALFRAFWAEGKDIADAAVVRDALGAAGMDAERILAGAESPPIKDELRKNTDGALERGVFGAPTFFVGEEMFWGNDRLDFVEAALRK